MVPYIQTAESTAEDFAMTSTATPTGIAGIFTGLIALVEDANPNAMSADTKAKVTMFSSLIGSALDSALANAGVSTAIPAIVDSSAVILGEVDKIIDAVAMLKDGSATTRAASETTTVDSSKAA